jgi:hypothetical protein
MGPRLREVTFMVAAASALIAGRAYLGRFVFPHREEVASPVTASSTP